ncbi:MAG TPA: hypothetical protein VI524_10650 [Anaerolineales bacterium]|nr:hypothetical protein [Anaerolineales bacterium]
MKSFIPLASLRASLQPSAFILVTLLSACLPQSISISPPANPGDILYQEEFEDNTTGWDRVSNEHGIMDYDGGGYRILVQQPGFNLWSTPEKNFGDVRVEADLTKLNGPDENRAGLMCRYQNGDYYFFIISSDGYYAVGKFIGGNTLLLGQTEMQPSELIRMNEVNHLRADCIGATLSFYVNFNQVAVVQDADFPSGDVGLLAGAFSQPGVDMLFDHFVVIQP